MRDVFGFVVLPQLIPARCYSELTKHEVATVVQWIEYKTNLFHKFSGRYHRPAFHNSPSVYHAVNACVNIIPHNCAKLSSS